MNRYFYPPLLFHVKADLCGLKIIQPHYHNTNNIKVKNTS